MPPMVTAADLHFHRNLLGDRVGGHDGLGSGQPRLPAVLPCGGQLFNPGAKPLHRHGHTDDAGGSHQHRLRREPQQFPRTFRLRSAAVHARLPRTGIGNAGIHHHRLGIGGLRHHFLIPSHRRRLYHIAGKSTCRPAGGSTVDQCHILPVLIFYCRLRACGLKAFRCGHSAVNLFHLFSPLYLVPHVPGQHTFRPLLVKCGDVGFV